VGEKIGPLVSVGVPGKSPGEVAFYWPERRLLMVGDAVIGHPPESLMLLRESVIEDVPRLRESVWKLLALDFDTLLTGDGQPIL
jgi:glyoxylase-like metal-dependent hydrolase (beta-lactamase superfamily II)